MSYSSLARPCPHGFLHQVLSSDLTQGSSQTTSSGTTNPLQHSAPFFLTQREFYLCLFTRYIYLFLYGTNTSPFTFTTLSLTLRTGCNAASILLNEWLAHWNRSIRTDWCIYWWTSDWPLEKRYKHRPVPEVRMEKKQLEQPPWGRDCDMLQNQSGQHKARTSGQFRYLYLQVVLLVVE